MANTDLELALILKVAQTGLENLTELIAQVKAAGHETAEFEAQAAQLNTAMQQFAGDRLGNELSDIASRADDAEKELGQLKNQAQKGQASQNGLADSVDDAAKAFDRADSSMARNVRSHKKVSDGVNSISTQLDRLQKIAGVAFLTDMIGSNISDMVKLADSYTNLNSRLELAVGKGKEFNSALQAVRDTANDTGSSLESVGGLYTKLANSVEGSAEEIGALTNTITQSFVVSGASAAEADAAITQLSQGLASGVLRGDEFNSVMEQSPRLAQAIADGLGVARGELRAMAADGKLTTEVLVNALKEQAQAIESEFNQMPDTVGRATQRLANEWQVFLGELNQSTGATDLAVSALNGLASNLDDIASLVGNAATLGAAALAVKFTPAIVASGKEMIAAAASGKLFAGSMTDVGAQASNASKMAGLLKGTLATVITSFVIDQAINLVGAYRQLSAATAAQQKVESELAASNAQLAARFADISEKTGVVVRTMADLDAAIAAGTIAIDEQTQAYVSAAQAAVLKAQRDSEAAKAVDALAYSQAQLSERLAEINTQLQPAIDNNSQLASVMSGSLLGAMKNGEAGVSAFAIALRAAEQQGQLTGEQISGALSTAILGLSDPERLRFGDLIQTQMGKIQRGAQDAGVSVGQLQRLTNALEDARVLQFEKNMAAAGFTTQRALDAAAQSAKALYQEAAALNRPLAEQQQAFTAYAKAALEANKNVSAGARQTVVEQLKSVAAIINMKEQLQQLLNNQQQVGDQGLQTGEDINTGLQRAGEGIDKTSQGMTNLKDASVDAAEGSSTAWMALGNLFKSYQLSMSELSESARAMFDQKMGIDSTGVVSDIDAIKQSIAGTKNELTEMRNASMSAFDATGVGDYIHKMNEAHHSTKIAFQEQKLKALEFTEALQSSQGVTISTINAAKTAMSSMNLLGKEDLSTLQSALDSANQKLKAMNDNAQSTLSGLQSELDRLQGNQNAIDKRDYESKRQQLNDKLEEARKWNNQEAVRSYTEALRVLDQVRNEKANKVREEAQQKAQREAASTAKASASTEKVKTVEVKLGASKVNVLANDEAALLDMLADLRTRS